MGNVTGRGRAQPEHVEQSMLITWSKLAAPRTPALRLLYAIPNGGGRSAGEAGRLKAEGVKAGIPDLCLPVARGGYHALYVEMKAGPRGQVSSLQSEWHEALRAEGNAVRVCFGFEQAKDTIERYLAGGVV